MCKEETRKNAPTSRHIRETYILFNDFGISDIEIPNFNTYKELEQWRTKTIISFLKSKQYV
jgi:hypothetical protein